MLSGPPSTGSRSVLLPGPSRSSPPPPPLPENGSGGWTPGGLPGRGGHCPSVGRVTSLPYPELGSTWRDARPRAAGTHLDSAACSRQSSAVLDAVARHARHEAEIGGYVAEVAAEGLLQQGRSVLAGLLGRAAADVAFTESASASLRTLLGRWRLAPGTRVGVLPGEYWHNLAALDLEVPFAAGEELRTEVSAKFRRPGVAAELAAAGLQMTHWWTDPAGDFALSLSTPG